MRPHESPNCDCPACSSHDFQEAEHAFPNLYPLPEHDDPLYSGALGKYEWAEIPTDQQIKRWADQQIKRWAELAKLMGKTS